MRGAKWMREASYLTDDDRDEIMRMVSVAKEYLAGDTTGHDGPRTVGVRLAAYCGEPHPIAAITYGPGGCRVYGYAWRRIA